MQMIPVKKLIDKFGNGYYPLSVLTSVINEEDITVDLSSAYKIGDLIPEKTTLNEIIKKIITGTRKEFDKVEDDIDKIITEDPERSIIDIKIKRAIEGLDYSDSPVTGKLVSAVSETDGKISVTRRSLVEGDIPNLSASKITKDVLNPDRIPDISIDKLIPGTENPTIPSSLLPSYVDDVLEFESISKFPAKGESGKIYIALDTNLTYRWSGTQYIEISKSLSLGHTSSTAFPGNEGLQNTQDIAAEVTRSTNKDTDLQNQIDEITGGGSGSIQKQIQDAIAKLDVSDTAVDGKLVSAVSETDGKISVTRRSLVEGDIPNLSASKITSGTINSARLPYTVETWTFVPSDGSASFTKNIVIS